MYIETVGTWVLSKKQDPDPVSQWYGSADPDPYQNVPDPQH